MFLSETVLKIFLKKEIRFIYLMHLNLEEYVCLFVF